MNLKLKKRITTSVILFLLTIFCIFINPYVFIIAIIIVSYLSWYETNHLINSINKSVTNWQRVVFNITMCISPNVSMSTFSGLTETAENNVG